MQEHNVIKIHNHPYKITCFNEKAQNTLYIKQKFTYILVLKGFDKTMLTDYVFTSEGMDMVKTESENRNLLNRT